VTVKHGDLRSIFSPGFTFLCFLGGLISIDNDVPSEEVDKRIDWLGAFLVTAGLVLIVFVLSQGELAPQGWSTPCKRSSTYKCFKIVIFPGVPDIIVLLILGVILMGLFFYWQHYLEKIHDNPESPFSLLTPPPLLKPSIWTRANGRTRCNDGDFFHQLVCVLVLDVLGTGSYETSPPLMSYRGTDERYFTIALFPELHALHGDADRCPSIAHVCIGTSV
jgi:hypothetical protein